MKKSYYLLHLMNISLYCQRTMYIPSAEVKCECTIYIFVIIFIESAA